MTIQEQKALELALEAQQTPSYDALYKAWHLIGADLSGLKFEDFVSHFLAQQSNEQGCKHCNHPLYCGTKCKNCGKQSNEQVEPVAWLIEYEACAGGMNRGSSLTKFDYVWHECSFVSEDKDVEIDATKWRNRKETPLFAHPPVPTAQPEPQTCNCRWDGDVQVQQCTLHEAHVDAIHEWAKRAKTAEAKLKAQPKQEPEQEPVGWTRKVFSYDREFRESQPQPLSPEWQPCFTIPPKCKPLTEEQIIEATEHIDTDRTGYFVHITRAIEAAHGIHPTGFKE